MIKYGETKPHAKGRVNKNAQFNTSAYLVFTNGVLQQEHINLVKI